MKRKRSFYAFNRDLDMGVSIGAEEILNICCVKDAVLLGKILLLRSVSCQWCCGVEVGHCVQVTCESATSVGRFPEGAR